MPMTLTGKQNQRTISELFVVVTPYEKIFWRHQEITNALTHCLADIVLLMQRPKRCFKMLKKKIKKKKKITIQNVPNSHSPITIKINK